MSLQQFIGSGDERIARRYDYDDGTVIVADLDVADDDVTIDVLDDVVLVVVDGDGTGGQFEVPVPEEADAKAFMNNGVLTIEVTE